MIETVFALLLIWDHEIKEHRIQPSLSQCLKAKRISMRGKKTTDRVIYQEGYEFLLTNGFKRLDFWGMGPINPYSWCTSIFYRKENCLEI